MSWIQWPVRRDQANGAPLCFRACVPTLNGYFSFTEKYWERRNLADEDRGATLARRYKRSAERRCSMMRATTESG
jgi:hypothetical protein